MRVHFPPIPASGKIYIRSPCSLPVELLLEWTNTLTGTKQPGLVRSIRLSWALWLDACSIQCKQWRHMLICIFTPALLCPWIHESEHIDSVDTSRTSQDIKSLFLMLWHCFWSRPFFLALSRVVLTHWGDCEERAHLPQRQRALSLITSGTLLRCTCSPCCALGQTRIN